MKAQQPTAKQLDRETDKRRSREKTMSTDRQLAFEGAVRERTLPDGSHRRDRSGPPPERLPRTAFNGLAGFQRPRQKRLRTGPYRQHAARSKTEDFLDSTNCAASHDYRPMQAATIAEGDACERICEQSLPLGRETALAGRRMSSSVVDAPELDNQDRRRTYCFRVGEPIGR
jgi:hypothetical protein